MPAASVSDCCACCRSVINLSLKFARKASAASPTQTPESALRIWSSRFPDSCMELVALVIAFSSDSTSAGIPGAGLKPRCGYALLSS